MGRILTKEQKIKVKKICQEYPVWKEKLKHIRIPKENGEWDDPVCEEVIKRNIYECKIQSFEEAIKDAVGESMAPYIIKGLTTKTNYHNLRLIDGIPCGYRQYYDYREEAYIFISQKEHMFL